MKPELFDIREATADDIPTISKMNVGIARETEDKLLDLAIISEKGVKAIANPQFAKYFVAENSGNIAGQTMVTYEWSDWRAGQIWWLQSVYVLPQHRRKGCYRALYAHIKNLAKKDPLSRAIRLYVMENNDVGKDVYSNLGMKDSGYIVYEEEWD